MLWHINNNAQKLHITQSNSLFFLSQLLNETYSYIFPDFKFSCNYAIACSMPKLMKGHLLPHTMTAIICLSTHILNTIISELLRIIKYEISFFLWLILQNVLYKKTQVQI